MPLNVPLSYLVIPVIIALIVINLRAIIKADVLQTFSLYQPGESSSDVVISLKNAGLAYEGLVIEDNSTVGIVPDSDYDPIIKEITEYGGDAYGYHLNFKMLYKRRQKRHLNVNSQITEKNNG
ncbi:uncharacterized protein [Eurosta solidaginis]|uniref:uncharacterized protein n=1 Tax=Eurosta solidaginis TaxID=178769 RepID=UPI003530AA0C